MTSPQAQKGARFEREILAYLREQFGDHLVRPRAGAARDLGDIGGIPDWTFELKNLIDIREAVTKGLADLRVEQANAGTTYGAVIVRRRGVPDPGRHLFMMELGAALPVIRETASWGAR